MLFLVLREWNSIELILCNCLADKFASVLREQQEMRRDRERQRIRLLTADPFDMEAQRLIANEIQQEVRGSVTT